MATYDGGYGGQQRQYGGPSPQRSAPRQNGNAPPPQQYNDYHNGNGYDNYSEGYGQDYGGQYQDQNYARGPPPPQDPYAQGPGYGGRPMPGGRGGPIHRPQTADPHRARPPPPRGQTPGPPGPGRGMHNGGPGRGGIRPGPYGAHSDPAARQPPMNSNSPISPRGGGFGGNYPPFPGQHRRSDEEIADQMTGMDLNQRPRVPEGRTSSDSQRNQMNGGRGPPPRGYPAQGPPQGYQEQRRGPPPGRDPSYGAPGGYGEYDDGYNTGGQGPPRNGFGPPARSMTMPVEDQGPRMQPLQRTGTMPVNGRPVDRGMPPQRPSTAAGHRPPPQRMYPAEPQVPPPSQYVGEYDEAHGGYRKPPAASYDDVYDTYFDNQQNNNPGAYGSNQRQDRTSLPDFDAIPSQGGRGSFEQTMRPAHEQQHVGAHQTAQLYHAKSQPDLQPQSAVFEMVGDAPSVPPLPPMNGYQQGYDQGYPGPGGHDHLPPRGPSAPPGGRSGLPSNPGSMRSGVQPGRNPDALPSHPTPVRPGLMANSIVHMDNKPPPVRNYGGVSERTPQQQQPPPQQQQPQRQQQPPPQQQPPRQASASQASAKDEPPVTPQELEHLRMVIKSNPADQESALRLARKLIEATDVLVPKLDPKQRPRARERYLIDCQKILKKLSNAQNQDAMFLMADSVGRGLFGHEPDFKEAFTMYQSAAKLGHAAAAYRTAVCCEIGHEDGGGTRKDPLKAIQWYKRAATLGDPPAMYKVGMILLKGLLGQPKNPREAVGWLKRAAERADSDNPHALHELGLLYESAQPNDVIIRDEAYAYSLFVQAADLGYKFSQYRLGCSYEYGLLGCPIDPRQSIMWYSRAATQEEHQAELALSGWYLTGSEDVLGQSDTEAYLWARKAAVAGLAKAEYAMGYFTEVGIGVPANLEDAKRWYWRAAAQDFPKARERLEDLKRAGKSGQRQRERISRSKIEKQQDGDCTIM